MDFREYSGTLPGRHPDDDENNRSDEMGGTSHDDVDVDVDVGVATSTTPTGVVASALGAMSVSGASDVSRPNPSVRA